MNNITASIPVDIYCSTGGCWYLISPDSVIVLTESDDEARDVCKELGYREYTYETTPFAFQNKSDADDFIKRITYTAGGWITPFLSASISRDGAFVVGIDGYVLD